MLQTGDENNLPAVDQAEGIKGRLLVVDDDVDYLESVCDMHEELGYEMTPAADLDTARTLIAERDFDHIILDLMLPGGSGLELFETIAARQEPHPYVTIATGNEFVASSIRKIGGPRVGYLLKPFQLDDLRNALRNHEADQSTEPAAKAYFGSLIGESRTMHELYDVIEKVADFPASVMILGESGVGKELVARAIHTRSGLSGPFVAANCGAFSKELLGSELFGHEKGAFTGAHARKTGLFEQAAGGTLFLDEITEMPLELQPALLRVLESRSFTRLGGTSPVPVDCRVLSATNCEPAEMANEGIIREDLWFRLAMFPINVPPLRERKKDIALLARYFLACFNRDFETDIRCEDRTFEELEQYDWPGNVRELRNVMLRGAILGQERGELVLPDNFQEAQAEVEFSSCAIDQKALRVGDSIETIERKLIELTINAYDGDKRRAASVLGVSLKTLYNRLKSYAEADAEH